MDINKAIPLNTFLSWKPKKLKEIISNGLLYEGSIMLLYGEQETYKSWLAINLMLAMDKGTSWLAYKTQKSRCLYLNPEIIPETFHSRIKQLTQARNIQIDEENLFVWTNLNIKLDLAPGRTLFLETIRDLEPELVIVDGLQFVCHGNLGAHETAIGLRDTIMMAKRAKNCSFIFIHHKKKGMYDEKGGRVEFGLDDMYGHSIIKNMADSVVMISKDLVNEDVIRVSTVKARTGLKIPPIQYRFNRETKDFGVLL